MTTNNSVDVSLAGQTGTGTFVGSTSPTLVTPVLGAATATSLNFGTSATDGIKGVTGATNAAAGVVGEYVTSNVSVASAISLTSPTPSDVTSISVTAGDWDIFGNVVILTGGSSTAYAGWTSTTSATQPNGSLICGSAYAAVTGHQFRFALPYLRVSVNTTTTVYLTAQCTFSTSTATACGSIFARRIR